MAAALSVALGFALNASAQTSAPAVDGAVSPAVAAGALDPETRVLARELAIRGAEAFDVGDYEAALENFNRATAILDVPSIAVMQARTLVKLGRWLEGLDRFQQTARLDLDASAPLPYREAVTQAMQEADALRRQIPQVALLVSADAERPEHALSVTFDDKPVPLAVLNISRPVNPGQHHLRVSAHGRVYFERDLDVEPSQQLQVHIPQPPTNAAATTSQPAGAHSSVAAPSLASSRRHDTKARQFDWPLHGAVALTGVGLVGAVTTAILGTNRKAELDDACEPNKVCPPQYEDDIRALNTHRTLFFLSAGVTVLAGGVATYLWLTDEDEPERVAVRVSPAAISVVGHY